MSKKATLITAASMLTIIVVVFGFNSFKQHMIKSKLAAYKPAPAAVTSITVKGNDWKQTIATVGHITANQQVNVTPQLSGQINKIAFNSGDIVKQGSVLIQLDDRLLQANLKTSVANLKLSQIEYKRQLKLLKTHNTSQDSVDTAAATLSTSQADVEYIKTQIDFMQVKAPFSGQVGIRQVNKGDFIQPGTTVVELQNLDEQYIDFTIPEIQLANVALGQKVDFTTDTYKGQIFVARISAIQPSVDSQSHNLDIRAKVDQSINTHKVSFISGMYVEANIDTAIKLSVIPVPNIAVTYSLYGNAVYVLKTDSKLASKNNLNLFEYNVERRAVTTGGERDGLVGVTSGLTAGEQIITSNTQSLKDGALVLVNNSRPFTQTVSKAANQGEK
ncbi:efflux RND transporter periplasmic adaptor subunit [Shewanella gelidimarina]|uniref:efflux RND transporter periplasmic adaptor subunit n=1 Tax=Shewanella gelidimarina TaxID=56813 RepID=UPI00200E4E76|nr:efflux RND transporter periplasmic adaptor subunit [Shewanella gelidimarina]MCL1058012.1 efflux RND transporter periplasmic adaptor subunit [Shewanella gelidimarina]